MLSIKLGTMPGKIDEYAVERGTKVGNALEVAGLNSEGYQIKVNGRESTEDTILDDGDLVLLVKQIKGNSEITVKLGTMPGKIEQYAVDGDTTIGQALEIAGLSSEGYQIKVNGNIASESDTMFDGDLVLLVKQIKGNK